MYEKYDATDTLRVGSGGEYGVQLGFGWTNGVVLDFLDKYAEKLVAPQIM
jgi:alpha,alpha-trehalase